MQEVANRVDEYVDFLHAHLDRFRDDKKSINCCFDYLLRPEGGGVLFEARDTESKELLGMTVILKTHMSGFLPENFLVYIAVQEKTRGQGVGSKIMKTVQQELQGEICLHVEKDNPARSLYERCGFTNKYDEMRFYPDGRTQPVPK